MPSGTQSSPSSFAARVTLGTVCTRAGNTDVLSHPVVMSAPVWAPKAGPRADAEPVHYNAYHFIRAPLCVGHGEIPDSPGPGVYIYIYIVYYSGGGPPEQAR